ncbi:MAG TPA: SigE family RNA polymerase sigma factor [Micromonosporaceae bacterium]|nr:SigE family RNA polymerase sigma factor [Micromonosporaceae bacterium]
MHAWEQDYVDYVTARTPTLRRLGLRLCGDEATADDLIQQTITTLYVRWKRVSAVEHLDAYVRTMVVRAYLNEKRRPWSRVGRFASAPDTSSVDDPDVTERIVLHAALAKIPPRQRAVLVLRFLYDLPVDEVAEMLRCSAGTVKSQTSRGLATLRNILNEMPATATENWSLT